MDSQLAAHMEALGMHDRLRIETEKMWAEYGLIAAGLHTEPQPLEPCLYWQRDEAWADIPLGNSSYTIGSAGCAMTAATMLLTMINPELTPGSVGKWLNDNNGYTGGNLYWARPTELVDGVEFVGYYKWEFDPCDMELVTSAIEANPQVIQVDFHPGGDLDTHFVLATGFTADGKDLIILDPWTGEQGRLLGVYGLARWDLERAIYALAEYRIE